MHKNAKLGDHVKKMVMKNTGLEWQDKEKWKVEEIIDVSDDEVKKVAHIKTYYVLSNDVFKYLLA